MLDVGHPGCIILSVHNIFDMYVLGSCKCSVQHAEQFIRKKDWQTISFYWLGQVKTAKSVIVLVKFMHVVCCMLLMY